MRWTRWWRTADVFEVVWTQIPYGNDNKKNKGKSKATVCMTRCKKQASYGLEDRLRWTR